MTTSVPSNGQPISLRIPSDPEHLMTARLFARGAGRLIGLDEERVETLRLLVSESCAEAMECRDARTVAVAIADDPDACRVEVVAEGGEPSGGATTRAFRRTLIEATGRDVRFEETPERFHVVFSA